MQKEKLQILTLKELQIKAREMSIFGRSTMRKAELIEAIGINATKGTKIPDTKKSILIERDLDFVKRYIFKMGRALRFSNYPPITSVI